MEYGVSDVAKVYGVSRGRVHQLIQDGRFPNARQLASGIWLIPAKDVQADAARRLKTLKFRRKDANHKP